MIGKIFRAFSNNWKTFSGGEGALVGLASGLRAWVGGRRGRERSFPGNGMRLEGGFPARKWERRRIVRGEAVGK